MPKRFLITAALPYANGPLHLGHLAGAYLPADNYVRYLRLHGHEVAFVCGSDEHGAAITLRARKEQASPQDIVDKYHQINGQAFRDFGISFDIFHRTTDPLHVQTASEFFLELHKKGVFQLQESQQFYDENAGMFLADRYIKGTCPVCGHTEAYGDQCEKCGSSLSPNDLKDPISVLSGATPIKKSTRHWYLPMEEYQDWIRAWIETGSYEGMEPPVQAHDPAAWKSHVKGQCLSWLNEGLRPRAMTRDLDWGIPVPLPEAEGKVLYVWLDAPIGYISATKAWAQSQGKDWKDFWCSPDSTLVHFIGKDNIVFHCIIFPMLLRAHGGLVLPENVPANEFLNLEGAKISTSRNHAVWLHEYLEEFPQKRDELRYVLTSIAPETGDSEFTWADFQTRVNSELVGILGNLVHRVLVLHHKYFEGITDRPLSCGHAPTKKAVASMYDDLQLHMEAHKQRQALQAVMQLARHGNRYLTEMEPWKLWKTDPAATREVLEDMLYLLAHLSCGLQVFLPDTASKLQAMLGLEGPIPWDRELIWEKGHALQTPEILFQKIEDEAMEAQRAKLASEAAANAAQDKNSESKPTVEMQEAKSEIQFPDFAAMDIRVATILEAEKVPKADKLLKLLVDTGLDKRVVVSGIAEHFQAEDLPGQRVCVLVNLAPRKLRGIESQGMILMAETPDGKLRFVAPDGEVANGSVVA